MTSSRPYLIRAIHEWIVDNSHTPYILVNAAMAGVDVPRQHVENDKIILNLSPRATQSLEISNDFIQFNARFGGVATHVRIPPAAVMAIYARENGQGMIFDKDEPPAGPAPAPGAPSSNTGSASPGKKGGGKPKLRVVK